MKRVLTISIFSIAFLGGGWRKEASTPSTTVAETRNFVFIYRGDTLGRESFTRNGNSLTGDLFLGRRHVHYEGRYTPNGAMSRLDVRTSGGSATVDDRVSSAVIGRDSAQLIDHLGRNIDTLRVASQPGMVPFFSPSIGLLELVVSQARAQKSQTAHVPVISVSELQADLIDVTFVTPDTAMLGGASGRDQMRLAIDAEGHVLSGETGADATKHYTVRPTPLLRPPGNGK